jgi:hypothetical protein
MEKTIKIDGKNVTFKATGGIMYRYKNQFGREYLADAMKMQNFADSKTKKKIKTADGKITFVDDYDYTKLNLELAYNLAWTLAKTADPSIPDPQTWLDSFNTFPIMEIIPQLNELLGVSSQSNIKATSKN